MNRIQWHEAVSKMKMNLVRVTTAGGGQGSGVIVPVPPNAPGNCCVLTAFHVVAHAEETGAIITIDPPGSNHRLVLHSTQRAIFKVEARDQALVLFNGPASFGALDNYKFLSRDRRYMQGIELGWLGFPALEEAEQEACFFSGPVSAYLDDKEAYLVDGASIHGVSGGPVFFCNDDEVVLAGIVTNYFPNQVRPSYGAPSQAWPGLAMFRTINPIMKLYARQETAARPKLHPVPSEEKKDPAPSKEPSREPMRTSQTGRGKRA